MFDSNCITPGTEFMTEVSKHLKYFIRKKIREDAMWQRLHVVFSGHEVCMCGVCVCGVWGLVWAGWRVCWGVLQAGVAGRVWCGVEWRAVERAGAVWLDWPLLGGLMCVRLLVVAWRCPPPRLLLPDWCHRVRVYHFGAERGRGG